MLKILINPFPLKLINLTCFILLMFIMVSNLHAANPNAPPQQVIVVPVILVAVAFTGEGATREGDFHEALNLAAVWSLPVVFVVENNGYGLSTAKPCGRGFEPGAPARGRSGGRSPARTGGRPPRPRHCRLMQFGSSR